MLLDVEELLHGKQLLLCWQRVLEVADKGAYALQHVGHRLAAEVETQRALQRVRHARQPLQAEAISICEQAASLDDVGAAVGRCHGAPLCWDVVLEQFGDALAVCDPPNPGQPRTTATWLKSASSKWAVIAM